MTTIMKLYYQFPDQSRYLISDLYYNQHNYHYVPLTVLHSYEEHESHSCDHLSDIQPKFVRKVHNLVLVYPYSIITGTGIGVRVKPKK